MTAAEFIQTLEGVRKSGEGWMCKCPSHEDRSASLGVASGNNGGVILHCFAGCTPYEITSAMGLSMSDLFPPKVDTYAPSKQPKFSPADILRSIDFEVALVLTAARTMANGYGINAKDYTRLELAGERIAAARGWAP